VNSKYFCEEAQSITLIDCIYFEQGAWYENTPHNINFVVTESSKHKAIMSPVTPFCFAAVKIGGHSVFCQHCEQISHGE